MNEDVAWDANRPVPWQRLMREWVIYVAIMAVVFALFMRGRPMMGMFIGLLLSGPLYLGVGYVLAKFGYQRKSLKEMRAESATKQTLSSRRSSDDGSVDGPRAKPAPTSRTGAASNRPRKGKRR